jgi:cell division transport system ATP-binding protein
MLQSLTKKKQASEAPNDSMIYFDRVTKRYQHGFALKSLSFNIKQGAMTFLIGHSGAGKSTLIKLIANQEKPTSGVVSVNQIPLIDLSHRKRASLRQSIGIILQNPQLLLTETVFYNVALPLYIAGWPQSAMQRRVHAALDKVNLLKKVNLPAGCLSAGEQHRVGIARAIVNKPKLLIADEPTANLDPSLSFEIIKLLGAFNQVGVTVLVATHDLHLIPKHTKQILVLEHGCMQET